ncbi:MAG: hypothetical protein ACD_61C00184G0002 [uncultured bacterium]|nr:MAG: hypothetical protein ACD_61C00184G0002 [uncultured bacterium]
MWTRLLLGLFFWVSPSVLSAEIITHYHEEDSQGYWVFIPYEYVAVSFDVGETPRFLYQVRLKCYSSEYLRVWICENKEDTTSAISTLGNVDAGLNGFVWDTLALPESVSVSGEIWVVCRFRNFDPKEPFFPGIDIRGQDPPPYTTWAKVWPWIGVDGFWSPGGTNLGLAIVVDSPLGIEVGKPNSQPRVFTLEQNYPNPFNPYTVISFSLKELTLVSLEVYNLRGTKVRRLLRKECPPGKHEVFWDGTDNEGKKVPSGVYFYELCTKEGSIRKKMILTR